MSVLPQFCASFHDRGPVPGGNRSAASCLCTVLRRALYHYSTRSFSPIYVNPISFAFGANATILINRSLGWALEEKNDEDVLHIFSVSSICAKYVQSVMCHIFAQSSSW